MANLQSLAKARKILEDLKQEYRFKKRSDEIRQQAEVQYRLGECRGELELSLLELEQTICTQSRNIADENVTRAGTISRMGRTELATIQEQMLWDAAIAYMLVKDAIVAIRTINSKDSISSAYEMLDAAASQLTGKKQRRFFRLPQVRAARSRSPYEFITSEEALKEKEELLDQFFDKLKATGDIERCLKEAEKPIDVEARRRILSTTGRTPSGGMSDQLRERLNSVPDVYADEDDIYDLNSATSIHPAVQQAAPVEQAASAVQQAASAVQQAAPAEQTAPEQQMESAEDLKKRVQNLGE